MYHGEAGVALAVAILPSGAVANTGCVCGLLAWLPRREALARPLTAPHEPRWSGHALLDVLSLKCASLSLRDARVAGSVGFGTRRVVALDVLPV